MRKLLMLLGIFFAVQSRAGELFITLQYLYQDAPTGSWVLQDDGNGPYIRDWKLPIARPTEKQLVAASEAAEVWWQEKSQQMKVESDLQASPGVEAMLEALLVEVNSLRAQLNLPTKSMDDLKISATEKLTEQSANPAK